MVLESTRIYEKSLSITIAVCKQLGLKPNPTRVDACYKAILKCQDLGIVGNDVYTEIVDSIRNTLITVRSK
jgi:hypothetical protein